MTFINIIYTYIYLFNLNIFKDIDYFLNLFKSFLLHLIIFVHIVKYIDIYVMIYIFL